MVKTDITTDISFDSFGELINGVSLNAFTIDVTNPDNNCPWDLYVENGVTITQISQYSTQGAMLPLSAIGVRVFNLCATPDQEYPDGVPKMIPDITGTYAAAFGAAGPHYVIGTVAMDGVMLDNEGLCDAGDPEINDDGNLSANPTTHRFRFDLRVTPDMVAIIQPGMYRLDMSISLADDASGADIITLMYSINIDIQPILQIKMSGDQNVDFTFSDINDYAGGVTKYGATRLEVNSSVNWDLMAIGTSSRNEFNPPNEPYFDVNATYSPSPSGTTNIPLDILELFQSPANFIASGIGVDYSPAFTNPPSGNNNIEVAYGSGVGLFAIAPYTLAKTIAGNWGVVGGADSEDPGSNLVQSALWVETHFSYVISYRIYPGLTVPFDHSQILMALPSYPKPGSYSMQVKYILAEDQ